jgi:hypothetical protein
MTFYVFCSITHKFCHIFEENSVFGFKEGKGITKSVAPEPEGSSLHSEHLASDPYPEPDESTPHPPNQSP